MTTQVTITAKLTGRVVQIKAAGHTRQFITPNNPSVSMSLSSDVVTLIEGATYADHQAEIDSKADKPASAPAKAAKKAKR